jgi:TPR repeat protein
LSTLLALPFLPATAQAQNAGDQGAAPATAQVDLGLEAKANAGDPAAQVLMGDNSCTAGIKATQDPKQLAEYYKVAAAWYRKAAEQGSVAGQLRLAALYRDGKGVEHDMVQAAEWYRKAADQGDASAQGTLGVLYSMGQGVAQSYTDAYFWFDVASQSKGPDQEKYAAYRQMSGEHLTIDELAIVQDRIAKWLAAHPR